MYFQLTFRNTWRSRLLWSSCCACLQWGLHIHWVYAWEAGADIRSRATLDNSG